MFDLLDASKLAPVPVCKVLHESDMSACLTPLFDTEEVKVLEGYIYSKCIPGANPMK